MAAQCCTSGIFAFKLGYPSLTHSFSVVSENITISYILSKTRFVGVYFFVAESTDLISIPNSVK